MTLSINEFKALCVKASLGAGLPPGLAVEAARASAWLSRRGLDGAGALLDSLQAMSSPARGASPGSASSAGDEWQFSPALAVFDGPSAFDLLAAGDARRVRLEALDSALLVLGHAGVAAATYGLCIELRNGDDSIVVSADRVDGQTRWLGAHGQDVPAVVASVSTGPRFDAPPMRCANRIEVANRHRSALDRLARQTLVPATEASRAQGAGGGDSAND